MVGLFYIDSNSVLIHRLARAHENEASKQIGSDSKNVLIYICSANNNCNEKPIILMAGKFIELFLIEKWMN